MNPADLESLLARLNDVEDDSDPLLQQVIELGPEAVDGLISLLGINDYLVAVYPCFLLGEIGDPRAIQPLIRALDHMDTRHVAPQARAALVKFGQPALEAVLSELANPDEGVRRACISALPAFRDPAAIPALIPIVTGSDGVSSLMAAESLIRLGEFQYLDVFAEPLSHVDEAFAEYGKGNWSFHDHNDAYYANFAFWAIARLVRDGVGVANIRDRVAPHLLRFVIAHNTPPPLPARANAVHEMLRQSRAILQELGVRIEAVDRP
ncbi:MAG: HEAT repeat domain-containing protein [Capsulimonadaceae bacterium]